MKINKISRRAFLLGLGAVSTAALLSACGGSASSSSAASGSAASGSAASAGSDVFRTLDEIKADGTVNIGVFSDKNPFGYVDENGEYQGYDVYYARRLSTCRPARSISFWQTSPSRPSALRRWTLHCPT